MCLFQEFGSPRPLELLLLCMRDERFAVVNSSLYNAVMIRVLLTLSGLRFGRSIADIVRFTNSFTYLKHFIMITVIYRK